MYLYVCTYSFYWVSLLVLLMLLLCFCPDWSVCQDLTSELSWAGSPPQGGRGSLRSFETLPRRDSSKVVQLPVGTGWQPTKGQKLLKGHHGWLVKHSGYIQYMC